MTDAPEPVPAHAMFKVLAALAELGEATAAAVADNAGLGYSTATAKLRAWEQTGQTERVRTDDNRAVWRLTDTGRATVGTDQATPPASGTASNVPSADPAQITSDPPDDALAGAADTAELPEESAAPEPENPDHGEPSTSANGTVAPPDASPSPDSDDERAPSSDGDIQQPATASDDERRADDDSGDEATPTGRSRRAKGSLRGAVLDILEAHPDRAYKTSELCKLIDAANAGTDAKKASAGAVNNAVVKLVAAGEAVQTVERPATFQLAPATGGE
ncbi:MarR family transcriptional regulator [Micromonospora sp. NPDC048830]|uniref:MarR family transcriptional regulator n=1 Tax=Micromonospora sp. NPDC048830 TaxID=3364257 RepID=UPI00371190E9